MINELSDLSLALLYMVKLDRSHVLHLTAEKFEADADRFYQVLRSRFLSDEVCDQYVRTVLSDFRDVLDSRK